MTRLYNMYFNTMCNVKHNLKNRKGQGMVEYVLIIALIAVVLILALTNLGSAIKVKLNTIITTLGGSEAQ